MAERESTPAGMKRTTKVGWPAATTLAAGWVRTAKSEAFAPLIVTLGTPLSAKAAEPRFLIVNVLEIAWVGLLISVEPKSVRSAGRGVASPLGIVRLLPCTCIEGALMPVPAMGMVNVVLIGSSDVMTSEVARTP